MFIYFQPPNEEFVAKFWELLTLASIQDDSEWHRVGGTKFVQPFGKMGEPYREH